MAIVPLLMALVAIPTTFLLIWPVAAVTDVSVIVQFLVALIGLGIAIDYALLVVVRWREERQQPDMTNEAAVRNAMQHAGSAVVFSGTTVAISLLALLAVPIPALRSIGIAGLLIALVSVAVAITLLPVVLATIGPKLDWPRNRRDAQRQPRLVGLGAPRRAPPLDCGRDLDRRAGRARRRRLARSSSATRAPTRSHRKGPHASGLEKLEDSGIGTGPLSPVRRARPLRRPRGRRAGARPGRGRPQRGGTRRLAPRRDGARHGHPDRGRQLAGGPGDARPPPRRRRRRCRQR